jgi:hypothetical protein
LQPVTAALIAIVFASPAPLADQIEEDGFDQPDAAAAFEYYRRAPTTGGIDTAAHYDRADVLVTRMPRFSTRIDRALPAAQPPARVWIGTAA